MKAYIVHDRNYDCEYSTVVFAETAGKAKQIAVGTEAFCDFDFTEIRVRRKPELDAFYRGKSEMDWFNDEDRAAMVRYAGFYCVYPEYADCKSCSAKEWCEVFTLQLKHMEEV